MDFSHHAYGIFGDNADIRVTDVLGHFSKTKAIDAALFSESNPDFLRRKFETLTIDDSRTLREIHESMPFSPEVPRIFIIEIRGATREAQNALLKVLEEPRPNNYFFITAPSADVFLPTVRSRLYIIGASEPVSQSPAENKPDQKTAADFLKMPLSEKIAFVDDLAAAISDDKVPKYEAVTFLNAVEKTLYDVWTKSRASASDGDASASRKQFETIARARDYANDRAPSLKMLLEYVALSL